MRSKKIRPSLPFFSYISLSLLEITKFTGIIILYMIDTTRINILMRKLEGHQPILAAFLTNSESRELLRQTT